MKGSCLRSRLVMALLCATTVAGCDGSSSGTQAGTAALAPAAIALSSGNQQTADVRTALPDPLRVRVTNRFGTAIRGAPVRWATLSGTGTLGGASSTTDSSGVAVMSYRTGVNPGIETVQAALSSADDAAVVFSVAVTPAPAFTMSVSTNSATLNVCTAHSVLLCTGTFYVEVDIAVKRDRYDGDIALSLVPRPSNVTASFSPYVIAGSANHSFPSAVPDHAQLSLSVFTFGFPFPASGYGIQQFDIRTQGPDGLVRTTPFTLTVR